MLFLKRKRTNKKWVKKFRRNIPFNETFSVAALNICEINLNHRKNLTYISEEFRLPCRRVVRNFLRAGELSENKCENSNFFSAIKPHVDIAVGFFPGSAV